MIRFFAPLLEIFCQSQIADEKFGPSPATSSKKLANENAKWPSAVAEAEFVGYERDGENRNRGACFQGGKLWSTESSFLHGLLLVNNWSLVRHFGLNGGGQPQGRNLQQKRLAGYFSFPMLKV